MTEEGLRVDGLWLCVFLQFERLTVPLITHVLFLQSVELFDVLVAFDFILGLDFHDLLLQLFPATLLPLD